MSGKYAKKKNNRGVGLAVILILAALAAAVAVMISGRDMIPISTEPVSTTAPTGDQTETPTQESEQEVTEEPTEKPTELPRPDGIDLGHGLVITDVGSYSGKFMEDGSDEQVNDVLMIVVYNYGVEAIQYAEIGLTVGDQTANFVMSTLPVGERMMILESGRMAYDADAACTAARAQSVAKFTTPMSLCEDHLQIQTLDGVVNVTNISDSDIDGDIFIYYKNSAADVYYGGITYRMRLEGGMKAGEIRQLMASHFSEAGSTIMFVTCGDN